LDNLFWDGKYNISCENCGSVLKLTPEEDNYLYELSLNGPDIREILNEKKICCNEAMWFWTIKPKVRIPNKIYYYSDIKEYLP